MLIAIRAYGSAWTLSLVLLFVSGCQSNPAPGNGLAAGDREAIVGEINRTLDDYKNAALRKDLVGLEGFWSDSKDFVFAGDGTIQGDRAWWSERLKQYDRETEKWLYWEYKNIHVEVLSKDAASCTLEFQNSRITKAGDTLSTKGSWTYVFKKSAGSWKAVQTNGTHVPL